MKKSSTPTQKRYYVYIVACADSTYYTGSTNDIKQRVVAHNTSSRGAKYTRSRRPVRLVYSESFKNKSKALIREAEIKALTRAEKAVLISTVNKLRRKK